MFVNLIKNQHKILMYYFHTDFFLLKISHNLKWLHSVVFSPLVYN